MELTLIITANLTITNRLKELKVIAFSNGVVGALYFGCQKRQSYWCWLQKPKIKYPIGWKIFFIEKKQTVGNVARNCTSRDVSFFIFLPLFSICPFVSWILFEVILVFHTSVSKQMWIHF
jgi:hypothetical protein